MAGVEGWQHNIGVGYGRLDIALAVTDRTGIRACAAWPHLQKPTIVDIGDRAATGADGMDIKHRRLDRIAVHDRLRGQPRLAALEQRNVGRGTAHVGRNEVWATPPPAAGPR